jgi:carbamate kinase
VSVSELKTWQQAGQFARGSMAPKVEAAIRHIEWGGERAIISHLECALPALAGQTGTHVLPD